MPLPVKQGEKQKSFVARAIRHYIKKGRDRQQAIAIAFSQWRRRKK